VSAETEKPGKPGRPVNPAKPIKDKMLTLRQVKSGICTPKDQKATLRSLGFRRVGQTVLRADHPAVRGMILKVRHLVEIVEG